MNIVVIGAPRSGTTLLAGLISASVETYPMLPECTYITKLIRLFHDTLTYSDPQRFSAFAIDEITLVQTVSSSTSRFQLAAKSHFLENPAKYLVLKDPELTLLADLIPIFLGADAKVVCVVRDPRAVIASMLVVLKKKRARAWKAFLAQVNWINFARIADIFFEYKRLLPDTYNYYWRALESDLRARNLLHVVQFEKIVAVDNEEFSRLELFLGFACGREGFGDVAFGFDEDDPTHSAKYGKVIQESVEVPGKALSRRQLRQIKKMFGGYNASFNWW